MIGYSYTLVWTLPNGDRTIVESRRFDTREAMEEDRNWYLIRWKERGWTPPKWWQWWRKGDSHA